MRSWQLFLLLSAVAGCTGTGPERPLQSFLDEQHLPPEAPVVLVDLDDTIYEKSVGRAMSCAADSLNELAKDHLIVYLTARPTYAKVPFFTKNRSDSQEFLEANGFPDGPLFTSSLWNWLYLGDGAGKKASFQQLREFGVQRIALAVGDLPHDYDAYKHNGHVAVDRIVILLIEDAEHLDEDRDGLSEETLSHPISGSGAAWPRIRATYRDGTLDSHRSWIVSQPPPGDEANCGDLE